MEKTKEVPKLAETAKKYRGSIREISNRSGYSYEYVRHVLQGLFYNEKIMQVAVEVFSEYKKAQSERTERRKVYTEQAC